MKYSYTIENLNCAHCAGKIEQKIANTEDFENVSYNFATKQLNFRSEKKNPVADWKSQPRPLEKCLPKSKRLREKRLARKPKFHG